MDNMTEALYDYLLNTGTCTEGELSLVTGIMGYNIDTLEAVLYNRTGYNSLEQMEG